MGRGTPGSGPVSGPVSAVMDLFRPRQALPDLEAELDPERRHPPLAAARDRHRQVVARGGDLMAELEPILAERAALVAAHGERALQAELAGEPLPTADLEKNEAALAYLDRRTARLKGQMDAVSRALPELEATIKREEAAAAMRVRERAGELGRPMALEIVAAVRRLWELVDQDVELRHAANQALHALGSSDISSRALPYAVPSAFDMDRLRLRSWEREQRAAGLITDAPKPKQPTRRHREEPKPAPRPVARRAPAPATVEDEPSDPTRLVTVPGIGPKRFCDLTDADRAAMDTARGEAYARASAGGRIIPTSPAA